jgi:hypothetical protein
MKKYSIFYKENYKYYPVYIQGEKFWLGGSRLEWLMFKKKSEAEAVAKRVRKQKSPFFEKGTIEVHLAKLQPWF